MNLTHFNELRSLLKLSGAQANNCIDKFLTAATGKPILDILKLDEIMHQRHGDYESEGKSMSDIVLEHYGQRAVDKINFILESIIQQ